VKRANGVPKGINKMQHFLKFRALAADDADGHK